MNMNRDLFIENTYSELYLKQVTENTSWRAIFSSPELKAQVGYCHSAPSVVRLSVRKLSHFRLLLWKRWTEFNETWQEARSQRPLWSLCFSGQSEKQDGRPGLWLAETFSTSPLKPLKGIQRNLTGSKTQRPLPSLCFSGRSEKQDGLLASDWPRHFRLLL